MTVDHFYLFVTSEELQNKSFSLTCNLGYLKKSRKPFSNQTSLYEDSLYKSAAFI